MSRLLGRLLFPLIYKMKYSSRIRWAIIWLADKPDNYQLSSRQASRIYFGHNNIVDVLLNKENK